MHLLKKYRNINSTVDGLNECDCDIHKKKVGVELLYNSVRWKFNQLETRCGRETQHPTDGTLIPPINQFGDQTSWGSRELEKWCCRENSTQQKGPSGPRLRSLGEQERNTVMAIGMGENMLQFRSVYNSLSHTTLSIKWELYFSKELCSSLLLCHCVHHACICRCIFYMCLYSWSWWWLYNNK